jgi:putative ABC transport system permease protein
MTWLRVMMSRFLALFRKGHFEAELDDELKCHLEMLVEENVRKGMPPAEARYDALRSLGGVDRAKESCRDQRSLLLLETCAQDIRYGLRILRRSPAFTTVAVLTLSLGIGATATIFSLVNGLLLQPLPYHHADALLLVAATHAQAGQYRDVTSYPDFSDWRNQTQVLEGLAAFRAQYCDLTAEGRPERVRGLRVTEDFLRVLEVTPVLGRAFLPEEYRPGKNRVVLLGDALWRNRLHADPDILGKTVKVSDEILTVVGVMPPGFEFPPNEHSMLYTPLPPDQKRSHGWLWAVGRLKSGIALHNAQAEMDTIARRLERQYPESNAERGINLIPLHEATVGEVRPATLIFMGAVSMVMLIVCANLANLTLSRTIARERELAVRAAIGAGRTRLVRQLLTESILVSSAGGIIGLLLAGWGVKLLVALLLKNLPAPRLESVSIDGWVFAFTFFVAMTAGIIFGLAPALSGSRVRLGESLQAGSRTLAGSAQRKRLRTLLVVAEMALALVLLIGAGLMMKSFLVLTRIDLGLDPRGVLALDFSFPSLRYSQAQYRLNFLQQVLERVREIPGVASAAWVADLPLTDNTDSLGFSIDGRPGPAPGKQYHARFNVVGPDYFRALGIPIHRGRDFSERDSVTAAGAAVINQAIAQSLWPMEDPLGKQISTDGKRWFSIVGVVGNVRQLGPMSDPRPEIYLSYLQDPVSWSWRTLIVKTAGEPLKLVGPIQEAVWSADKDQPISDIRTLEQVLWKSVAQPRVFALLLGVFALMAMILAAIGIYGVVSYSVTQRTQEFGVRIALGATRSEVLRMVLGEGLLLTAIGLSTGLLGAVGMTRVLAKFLFEVQPTDPATYIAVILTLAAVATAACYVPARRATKVDPIVSLRYE